jgi:hypothetical protein
MKKFVTKDSGERIDYESGMRRDIADNKPRFDLITPEDQKYEDSLLYRFAMLLERGRIKYGERNWQKACSQEELNRFKASAWRHFVQYMCGEEDEDHASATIFNINAMEYVKQKLGAKK